MYADIVWMHDLSERAVACEAPVRALARKDGGVVAIVHATGAPVEARGGDDAALKHRAEDAQVTLNAVLDRLAADGIQAELMIHAGQPAEVASQVVAARGAALLVAGATGSAGLDRLLLGSTASRLVREVSCPVLVVHRPFEHVRRILCAVDLAHPSEAAILHAAGIARSTGAAIDFVTVVAPLVDLDAPDDVENRLGAAIKAVLGHEISRNWTWQGIVADSAFQGILHRAAEVDLVVMGSAGRRGWRRFLLGSVAEAVVNACPTSVLVVR